MDVKDNYVDYFYRAFFIVNDYKGKWVQGNTYLFTLHRGFNTDSVVKLAFEIFNMTIHQDNLWDAEIATMWYVSTTNAQEDAIWMHPNNEEIFPVMGVETLRQWKHDNK